MSPKKTPREQPSREAILAFIASQSGKVGKREIARHFGFKGAERLDLKEILRDLSDDGLVKKGRGKLHKDGALPPVTVADITGRDGDGDLIASPADWDAEIHGTPPVIVVVVPHKPRAGEPVPGVGDRVLMRLADGGSDGDPRPTGRVIKILDRGRARILGVFRAMPQGGGRLSPIDKKNASKGDLIIPLEAAGNAKDGDLVTVDLVRTQRFGPPLARVKERLGNVLSEKAISLIAIHAHDIPHEFPDHVLAAAESVTPATLAGREDWRKLPLITIDPPDAKDHDDAVHAEHDPDPDNPGGYIITIAIADVAAYVRTGSALDKEALKRGNSVYFPDRVVPMLPERLSTDLLSLRPDEDRPALACRVIIRPDGRRKTHSFHRIMMRSAAKLAYAQAQAAMDGVKDKVTDHLLDPIIKPLYEAYAALKRARDDREPLDLDLPERKIVLTPEGMVDRVIVPQRLDAHKLIEEMMILANVCAAESLEKARVPCMYRIHDAPSFEKLLGLKDFLGTFDIKLPQASLVRPMHFNQILRRAEKENAQELVSQVILRSQSQAEYNPENIGHFGLNLRRYAHFTSPIRRYSDLLVHRGLITGLGLGDDGLREEQAAHFREIGAEISACERRAMAAERETIERLIAAFLAERIGEEFPARISGVTKSGIFVRLEETGADGFIPAATIGDEFFRYEETQHALTGTRSGMSYRLGDKVDVRLVEAAPVAGALRFEMMSSGTKTDRTTAKRTNRHEEMRGRRLKPGDRPAKAPWRKKGKR